MPIIIDEVDIVLEAPADSGETPQVTSASVTIAEAAFEDLLRYLAVRQRRLLAD